MWKICLVIVGIAIIVVAIAIAANTKKRSRRKANIARRPRRKRSDLVGLAKRKPTPLHRTLRPLSSDSESPPTKKHSESPPTQKPFLPSASNIPDNAEDLKVAKGVSAGLSVENDGEDIKVPKAKSWEDGWDWGCRKVRRVLPYSAENESACASSYECSPFAQVERYNVISRNKGGVSHPSKSVGMMLKPCDPAIVASPTTFFVPSRKRYFFGVGINYVSQPQNRLTSCWNDIDRLFQVFSGRYGGFDRSWLITDRPKDMRNGLSPTAAKISQAWKSLLTEVKQHPNVESDIIFVYSGHGTFRLTTDPGELTGQSDAIVLLDQLMYDYDVMAQIVRPLDPNVHLLIVFDSCNSGSAANLPWTFNPLSLTVNQTSLHTDLTNDVMMISGCRDEQTSAAGATPADLSECTRVLVETLHEHPKTGSLALSDLMKTMRHKLVAAQDTQIPQLSLSKPQLLSTLL